jgi:hypothetical protein
MLLGTLVQTQHLMGTQNNGRGQAGEACDVDSVTPIRGALLYAMQKNDAVGRFLDGNMQIFQAASMVSSW